MGEYKKHIENINKVVTPEFLRNLSKEQVEKILGLLDDVKKELKKGEVL